MCEEKRSGKRRKANTSGNLIRIEAGHSARRAHAQAVTARTASVRKCHRCSFPPGPKHSRRTGGVDRVGTGSGQSRTAAANTRLR